MKFKKGQLEDLKKANKAISRLIDNPTKILFPKMRCNMKIVVYAFIIPIHSLVDSRNLQLAITSTTLVADKWLRVVIATIQQAVAEHNIKSSGLRDHENQGPRKQQSQQH